MTETLTERIHDERLWELLREVGKCRDAFDAHRASALSALRLRSDAWLSHEALIEALRERGTEPVVFYRARTFTETADALEEVRAAWSASVAAVAEHERAYTGWVRFFLLTSSDGHVHRSMDCSTCNKGRTASTFSPMPFLSGTSVATAVEVLGASLCSVCFPEAPVEMVDAERIPARLARVLFEKGEAAFHAARAEAAAKTAARCAGSGKVVPVVDPRSYRKYGKCPECGGVFGVSTYGKVAAHKPAA